MICNSVRHIGAVALCALLPSLVSAQAPAPRHAVLAVPAKYPSIQAAIDSAIQGDTVLVAPGRYYENIRFKGKGIVVASQFAHTRDAADIDRTIIDGSRPAHPDTGTVVRFVNQEDSTAVLEGFTITGGTGTIWLDAKDIKYFREGGGILCELGSPTIRYNHIVNNVATSTTKNVAGDSLLSAGGGAIRCGYSEPTITNNVIRGNRGRYGGGVVLFYSAGVVKNNLIVDNTGGEDFGGAGLWIVGGLELPTVDARRAQHDRQQSVEHPRLRRSRHERARGRAHRGWDEGRLPQQHRVGQLAERRQPGELLASHPAGDELQSRARWRPGDRESRQGSEVRGHDAVHAAPRIRPPSAPPQAVWSSAHTAEQARWRSNVRRWVGIKGVRVV